MPPLETSCLNQDGVLWTASGSFDDAGEETVDAAIPIKIRHEIGKKKAVDSQGNVVAVDSVAVVDRTIAVGSILWPGNIDDIATPPVDLLEVMAYSEIPDVKGRNFRKTVGLVRHSDELPGLA